MAYVAIVISLAWTITAALFVVGERISHARASRARIANRLASVQHFYGADSGSQEKCSVE